MPPRKKKPEDSVPPRAELLKKIRPNLHKFAPHHPRCFMCRYRMGIEEAPPYTLERYTTPRKDGSFSHVRDTHVELHFRCENGHALKEIWGLPQVFEAISHHGIRNF